MENVHCKCKRDNHEVPKHYEYQGIIETNYLKTEKFLFNFFFINNFVSTTVRKFIEKRLVKSFSRKAKFTVTFKLFALVFISKELLRKGRILVQTC